MNCEAMTLKPGLPQCTRTATYVVGTRYWGDLATDETHGRLRRRTWVEFWGACTQHVNGMRWDPTPLLAQWAHEWGRVGYGAANGQALGYARIEPASAKQVHIIPPRSFDIEAVRKAGQ